ncbi:hypothetical protein BSL78_03005 [Apostichopus japonicus]|uniref:Fibrinogen C-terminal domain-containing protein n=1 Tax=Stichopus japonicus TaxID=307972 RepID=A0A2G8LIT9_STIJA|nr:hypothetical protein BSL78_03005 [Apostichopus japonicus]
MDTDGGGWTVFQKRLDGSVGFYNGWSSYKYGFGNINSEYWLGNEKLFYLTAQSNYELRVDLSDFEGNERYARYDSFRLGDEATYYELLLGAYSGNAGDSLGVHLGMSFTTKDADHDLVGGLNCASHHKGAWWYNACYHQGSNLNGLYHGGPYTSFQDGVVWLSFRGVTYSLKTTEMKNAANMSSFEKTKLIKKVFQKRLDGSVGFYNGWSSYKYGFGNINSEYWLGNEKLSISPHRVTTN